jgi:carbamoyl-phosphate synthase small subunit
MPQAVLVLEDGTVLTGRGFGAPSEACFEMVFNTSLTGYQEILTDASYRRQGIVFTAPHIGNVGINIEDYESQIPQASAVIVRSVSPAVSNWRAEQSLDSWLKSAGIPGISEVDTRYLTRKLRDRGTMRAVLSNEERPVDELLAIVQVWPGLDGLDLVQEVTCHEPFHWLGDASSHWVKPGFSTLREILPTRVVLFDFGVKRNIARHLQAWGSEVWVVPADTSEKKVMEYAPDGVVLSNGPGDPAGLPYIVETVKNLIESGIPIFGICLGHQVIGRALGGETRRLKFGHHGGNHPVQDLRSKKVQITAQNHNYTVVGESLDPEKVEITHLSLNDGTLEGFRMRNRPVFCVQFHPEAAPGPHDAHDLFGEFWQSLSQGAGN